ncbi:MAG: hypothetical protein GY696_11250, partial [Gammaproteobacteria bacterium]|nr:hypothetical protein [Gammaproteobacteria bacterium]
MIIGSPMIRVDYVNSQDAASAGNAPSRRWSTQMGGSGTGSPEASAQKAGDNLGGDQPATGPLKGNPSPVIDVANPVAGSSGANVQDKTVLQDTLLSIGSAEEQKKDFLDWADDLERDMNKLMTE